MLEGVVPRFNNTVPLIVALIVWIWRGGNLGVMIFRLFHDEDFSRVIVVWRSMHLWIVGACALDCLSRTHPVFERIGFKKKLGHHWLYLVLVEIGSQISILGAAAKVKMFGFLAYVRDKNLSTKQGGGVRVTVTLNLLWLLVHFLVLRKGLVRSDFLIAFNSSET